MNRVSVICTKPLSSYSLNQEDRQHGHQRKNVLTPAQSVVPLQDRVFELNDAIVGSLDEGVIEEILVSLPLAENTEDDFFQFISEISDDNNDTVINPSLQIPLLDRTGSSSHLLDFKKFYVLLYNVLVTIYSISSTLCSLSATEYPKMRGIQD